MKICLSTFLLVHLMLLAVTGTACGMSVRCLLLGLVGKLADGNWWKAVTRGITAPLCGGYLLARCATRVSGSNTQATSIPGYSDTDGETDMGTGD